MVVLSRASAYVVDQRWAVDVIGPGYDSVDGSERIALADANPESFYNVIRSQLDYAQLESVPADLAARSRSALRRLLSEGRYRPIGEPAVFLYQLSSAGHDQTAVIADVPVAAFAAGVVRPHEQTRETQEDELIHQLGNLGINASPVVLTYRADPGIASLIAKETATTPELNFRSVDGVRQRVWRLDPTRSGAVLAEFERIGRLYIVDGHHRVAVAARLEQASFLAGIVAHDELRVLPFHRIVTGPIKVSPATLRALGAEQASIVETPRRPGEALIYSAGTWYRVTLSPSAERPANLDVQAADELLGRLADIDDARTDMRLHFVPGTAAIERLEHLADETDGLAIALYPPSMAQLFAEADADRTMPPKSTYFEPKLRSGVFLAPRR